jgi:diguanylate cyclase (GGDEF)-like protein
VLARLGGDEFAVLVVDVKNAEEVAEITSRLQRCFDGPFYLDSLEVMASASIGCALYPEDAITRDKLLELADIRMYTAKRRKRPEAAP